MSSGFVESRRISSGEPFAIWISFENQSAQAIENLRFVEFRMPGFDTDGTCWRPVNPSDPKSPKAPACRPDFTDPTSPVGLPPTLQPGEAVTVTGQVVRGRRSGEFMLTGGYTWSDESGHQHRAMVPVGPIEIAKDWWDWRARLSEDLPVVLKDVVLPFAKDLAWPLVFFLLGWMFKAGEQKRAALQETWKEMLSTSHQIAVQHYLPLSSSQGSKTEEQKKQEELESNRIQEVKAVHEALRRFRRHNSARKAPWGTKWAVRWWHDLRLQAGEL